MKQIRVVLLLVSIVLLCSLFSPAQQSVATAVNATVPPLIQFSNVATDEGGSSMSGEVSITFSLYNNPQGGEPLWTETQNNVQLDPTGHYSVQLGITKPAGVPTTLFTTGEARWLGMRIAEQAEQPRVLLLSVPYALKAGDAATIGGLPPSAFVMATPGTGSSPTTFIASAAADADAPPASGVTGSGTTDFIPLWTSSSNLANSILFQSGTGATASIGVNTSTPAATLDVKGSETVRGVLFLPATGTATAAKGASSQPLALTASVFNSGTGTMVAQNFRWQAQPTGNNTSNASAVLDLLYSSGTNVGTETGLQISSAGLFTFAPGQTFPGTGDGTITGVTAGTNLTGGGTSGNVTLNLNTANVPLLAAANTFTGTETVNASGTAINATATAAGSTGVAGTAQQFGLYGTATGTTGNTVGVYGIGADGLQGSGTVHGVYGASSTAGGIGVYGTAPQFGLYGTATGSGKTVGVFGSGADGVQGSGTVYGVYGASSTTGATGVYGTAPQFGLYGVASGTGNTVGVFGTGADGLQGSGTVYGVYGASSTTGATGVYGTAPQFGLYGVASGSGNTVGVYGSGADGLQGTGTVNGVYAAGGSDGVYGTAPNFGLYGVATATSGNSVGVFGYGIDGLQGSGTKYGVYSAVTSTGTAGTYGVYGSPSSTGMQPYFLFDGTFDLHALPQAGVWADTNWDGDLGDGFQYVPALLATADNNLAAAFVNNSNLVPAIIALNSGTGGGGPSAVDVLRAEGTGGSCTLTGGGDAACTGTLKSVVATTSSEGARRVETYAVQSAENWFEDAGTAQLVNGTASVNLEPVFGQTVNTGVEYHVFLTPDGDCKGLYVSSKSASGFEVRELGGGASSIAFEYRIMAKRVGYETVRLKNLTERFNKQEAQSKKMQRPARASAATQPGSVTPMPPLRAAAQQ